MRVLVLSYPDDVLLWRCNRAFKRRLNAQFCCREDKKTTFISLGFLCLQRLVTLSAQFSRLNSDGILWGKIEFEISSAFLKSRVETFYAIWCSAKQWDCKHLIFGGIPWRFWDDSHCLRGYFSGKLSKFCHTLSIWNKILFYGMHFSIFRYFYNLRFRPSCKL